MLDSKLENILIPVVSGLGLEVFAVERIFSSHIQVVRVFLDKPGGVSSDDCSEASKLIKAALTVENAINFNEYDLEVSSPGVERKLFKIEHYEAQLNKLIKVKLKVKQDKKKTFIGVLDSLNSDKLALIEQDSNIRYDLDIDNISSANVIFQ